MVRRYYNFGLVHLVVPQGHGSGKRQGLQVPGMRGSAPTRSSAARAAHRDQGRSYICFGPIIPEALARGPLFVPFDIEACVKGAGANGAGLTGPKQM